MTHKLINVVLDLETLGTSEDAAIIQIGCAVPYFDQFNLPEDCPSEFEVTIKYEDCINGEFAVDGETMEWWELQDKETKRQVFSGQEGYLDAFDLFTWWVSRVRSNGAEIAVWGNGADFDNRLLSYSLNSQGFKDVWHYRHNRCLRTLRALFPPIEPPYKLPRLVGEREHTALGDALYEARVLDQIKRKYKLENL